MNIIISAGIMFLDITTLLLHPKAFKDTIDLFVDRYKHKNISVVAGKNYLFLSKYFYNQEIKLGPLVLNFEDVS